MIIFSPGTYFAFPIPTLVLTLVVFSGVGILRMTLLALSFESNAALRCIVYSTRDFVGSVTCVCSLNGRLILDVDRYLMQAFSSDCSRSVQVDTHFISSNSPSGGMNEIERSVSNLPNLTHWWNWQSSSSTASSDRGVLVSRLYPESAVSRRRRV
jgi:hypothetical protein